MSTEPVTAGSVEFGDYLRVLKRQLGLVLVLALLGGAAAAAWSFRRTAVYESTASVLVRPITTNPFDPGQRTDQQLNMNNQRQLALSEPVAALAGKALSTSASPQQLLEHVSADVPQNSQIVRIHYKDTVPLSAQRGASAFGKAYLDFRKADAESQAKVAQQSLADDVAKLQSKADAAQKTAADDTVSSAERIAANARFQALSGRMQALQNQLNAYIGLDFTPGTVIDAADLPSTPASPNHKLDVGIGLFLGLFLAVALAFVRDRTDSRLRGREDLAERLDRPVLAVIPSQSRWRRRDRARGWRRRGKLTLVTLDRPNSPSAEAYRTLRTRMARLAATLDINSIMVVSADVGEGKSTTAANLAVALAESGKDVLLVSADLRRPRIQQFFSLPHKSGLSNVLADGSVPKQRPGGVVGKQMASELWSVAPNLWVILSGPQPPHPSTLMDSDAMRQFLKEQRDLFDFIILDCPPALVVADALALAPLADAVLVVADAKESHRDQVNRLRDELDQVGGRIVGAVLNRSRQRQSSSYYYQPHDD
ncbi:MAG TPA: polysaccharide biosynthesis tyrosine autokinase [Actinomycetes bacterium]|nr:polysaccharide biosynthesis tyrosine autokinase [Actinomycetes bacterium]